MAETYPLRILLAEDNLVNQKVALGFLKRYGYRADVAGNGVEVLEALKRQQYDVILMDINMPELDGIETTRCVRRDWPANEQPRIIAMTANALREDRTEYLANGMDDYVSKPVRPEQLEAALRCAANSRITTQIPEPVPEITVPSFDRDVLHEFEAMMGEDGPEAIIELVTLFLDDSPQLIDQIEQGISQQNADLVRRAAHTLKSSAANLGAKALAEYCLELETRGRQDKLVNADKIMNALVTEFDVIKLRLEAERTLRQPQHT